MQNTVKAAKPVEISKGSGGSKQQTFDNLVNDVRVLNVEIKILLASQNLVHRPIVAAKVIEEHKMQEETREQHQQKPAEGNLEEEDEGELKGFAKLPVEQYPLKKIFILKGKRHSILTQITEVNLRPSDAFYKWQRTHKKDENLNLTDPNLGEVTPELAKYHNSRYFLFLKYDEGIKLDRESWYSVTPEIISEYQAKRLSEKYQVVLDGFCGAGGNTIQFAKYFQKVIANDIDSVKSELCDHNCKVYNVRDRVELTTSSFLTLQNPKVDLVYIAPPWGGPEYTSNPNYSLYEGITPAIDEIIKKAFEISENIVLSLPRNINVTEMADIFGDYFEKYNQKPQRMFMEVEQVKVKGKIKLISIYYGNASHVTLPFNQ